MDELVPAFDASLFDSHISDIGLEYLELGIDSILKDGILKDIPIVRTIIGFGKLAQNIHDRNLLLQTLSFIQELNSGTVTLEKYNEYRTKWAVDPYFREKELGYILIILNRNIDITKSKLEAKFFSAYIDKQIDWNDFCELCEITDRLFVSDIKILDMAYRNGGVSEDSKISYRHDRLVSIGLLINEAQLHGGVVAFDLDNLEHQNILELTEIGRKFCNIAFRLYV